MEEKSSGREGRGRGRGGDEEGRSQSGGERRDRRIEKSEEGEDSTSRRRPSKNPTREQHKRHLDKLMENPVMCRASCWVRASKINGT